MPEFRDRTDLDFDAVPGGIPSCCVGECKGKVTWRIVRYNERNPRSGVAIERYVCDDSWHIIPQRSVGGRYPDDTFRVESGRKYHGLIEDRAKEFKNTS